MRDMMRKLKLTVNENKTQVCKLPKEKFDFLGYTFGRCYSPQTGQAYLGTAPSKQRVQRVCAAISEATRRNRTLLDVGTLVATLNRLTVGWANYFCLGPVSKAYRSVERHARRRLRWWLCAKHKVPGGGIKRYPDDTLHDELGLVRLTLRTASFPWAKACAFSESRMREIRQSGSMSGMWKRSMVRLVRHRQTKGPATDRPYLNHRATSRLYK